MLSYKHGNIVYADETYIMHGCNAQGRMASGVAKAIRARWPNAYEAYIKHYNRHGLSLGSNIYAYEEDKVIVNAITQQNYGYDGKQYCSYEAIRQCCIFLREELDLVSMRINATVAMPRIGAGLGGGNWETISTIIEEELKEYPITIYEI